MNPVAPAAADIAAAMRGTRQEPTGPLGMAPESPAASGAVLFARFAYPPNELGYCGPNDSAALLQYGASGEVDRGLAQLARGFGGAWPYLEFIAGRNGIADPLDRRVVEAYWLGNELLDSDPTAPEAFGAHVLERFRRRAGQGWSLIAQAVPVGAVPNHAFHVFSVYPWVGLLGSGGEHPLHVLDRCRIRWGKVAAVEGDSVVVLSRPLTWDGRRLALGPYRAETVTRGMGGTALAGDLEAGNAVALHWGWICSRLSRRQLANLRRNVEAQIAIANRRLTARSLERVLE